MKLRRLAPLGYSLSLGLALAACHGKASAPVKQGGGASASAKTPATAETPAKAPAAMDGAGVSGQEAPPAAPSPTPPTMSPDDKARGRHLADPSWFRKTMFGDKGKVLDTKRSAADDRGLFSSLIRFELTDMTVEACADHLEGLVKTDIPAVEREAKPDGRIQLSGNTDSFKITFLCGEAQGKTIAYVSYSWT